VSSALDQCTYLERCNLGSIAEYLQDVILFLEDLAPVVGACDRHVWSCRQLRERPLSRKKAAAAPTLSAAAAAAAAAAASAAGTTYTAMQQRAEAGGQSHH
jgi:hypothetical protein